MEHRLGLYDTPPTRGQIRLGIAIVALLVVALVAIFPERNVRVAEIGAFVPTINAVMFVAELSIAALFYAQAALFRSRALIALASGYVLGALLLVPHALTFPGAFSDTGLMAGTNTTAWLGTFRRVVFPLTIILYAGLNRAGPTGQSSFGGMFGKGLAGLSAAIILAGIGTAVATLGHDLLPGFFVNRSDAILSNLAIMNATTIALTAGAMIVLHRNRSSILDLWLMVALSGWLIQSTLNLFLEARFTVGWYCLFVIMMMSSLTVMLALVSEAIRLHARLAISTAVASREHEARLMSMDAMAAAMAHEISQSLTAVSINAAAGLDWLGRKEPNVDSATRSIRATLEATRQTFAIIKSTRAMFADGRGLRSEFDLNALVRETALLMDRELAAHRISLQLALDEDLLTVFGNRPLMQQALLNLSTNVTEAVLAAPRGSRGIVIRSEAPTDTSVLMEVRDVNRIVRPGEMTKVFEPVLVNETSGRGLRLSLSWTIIEGHGGSLWTPADETGGEIFHLQLPRSPVESFG